MSHDEPRFGERPEANDPEALNESMERRGYRPWTPGTVDNIDAEEIRQLAGKPKQHQPREPLGRVGKITTTVVLLAILGPFVLLLWVWALTVTGLL